MKKNKKIVLGVLTAASLVTMITLPLALTSCSSNSSNKTNPVNSTTNKAETKVEKKTIHKEEGNNQHIPSVSNQDDNKSSDNSSQNQPVVNNQLLTDSDVIQIIRNYFKVTKYSLLSESTESIQTKVNNLINLLTPFDNNLKNKGFTVTVNPEQNDIETISISNPFDSTNPVLSVDYNTSTNKVTSNNTNEVNSSSISFQTAQEVLVALLKNSLNQTVNTIQTTVYNGIGTGPKTYQNIQASSIELTSPIFDELKTNLKVVTKILTSMVNNPTSFQFKIQIIANNDIGSLEIEISNVANVSVSSKTINGFLTNKKLNTNIQKEINELKKLDFNEVIDEYTTNLNVPASDTIANSISEKLETLIKANIKSGWFISNNDISVQVKADTLKGTISVNISDTANKQTIFNKTVDGFLTKEREQKIINEEVEELKKVNWSKLGNSKYWDGSLNRTLIEGASEQLLTQGIKEYYQSAIKKAIKSDLFINENDFPLTVTPNLKTAQIAVIIGNKVNNTGDILNIKLQFLSQKTSKIVADRELKTLKNMKWVDEIQEYWTRNKSWEINGFNPKLYDNTAYQVQNIITGICQSIIKNNISASSLISPSSFTVTVNENPNNTSLNIQISYNQDYNWLNFNLTGFKKF